MGGTLQFDQPAKGKSTFATGGAVNIDWNVGTHWYVNGNADISFSQSNLPTLTNVVERTSITISNIASTNIAISTPWVAVDTAVTILAPTNVLKIYLDWTGYRAEALFHSRVDRSGTGPYVLTSGATVTNLTLITTTFDPSGGNTLKFVEYAQFPFVHIADGAGAVIATNDNSALGFGHATFSGSGATNANFVLYDWIVPDDIDTAIDLKIARFQYRTAGTSTNASTWNIGMREAADSAAADSKTLGDYSNYVQFTSAPASPAAGDIFTVSAVTLTSWRTSITAGRRLQILLNRDGAGDANNDALAERHLSISYGRTQ
jgi:hypothetical protein